MLARFTDLLKKHSTLVTFLFFAFYLALGFLLFDDYGISTDEIFQNEKAIYNLDYITGKSDELLTYPDRHYGAVLAIPLYLFGKIAGDPRTDYLVRHLVTFLIFYGSAIVFYLLARRLKLSKPAALIGTAMYIFHPHIFSHSFYNIKDSPFLALYLVNIYSLLRWSEKPNFRFALLHGFLSGLLVVFRLPGLLMWAITFLVWLWILFLKPREWKRLVPVGATYAIAAMLTLFIFVPTLWHDPIGEARAFFSMELFTWDGKELFMGKFLTPAQFPRYYLPVYILVTTPLVFTGFMIIGVLFALRDLFLRREFTTQASLPKIILLLTLFFPMLYIMAARPIIYNGWRHVFFIYAPFALLAAMGIDQLWKSVSTWNTIALPLRELARSALIITLAVQAFTLAYFMVVSHPYEHVFYNRLAGETLADASQQFSMDYWGLSYREGLETILEADSGENITVCGALNHYLRDNQQLLQEPDRSRIHVTKCSDNTNYYLTNYHYKLDDDGRGGTLIHQIEVFNAPILGIFKLGEETSE